MNKRTRTTLSSALAAVLLSGFAQAPDQPNIVFVLTDDQRYDAMGFLDPVLDTPNMDRMARGGVHFESAVVSTALCSPSRASIMTGQYMHGHGIVDNNVAFEGTPVFFPQLLQAAGYETAFIGKWHMGSHGDEPQPGFDRWVSFEGQGHYLPEGHVLNVDGERVPQPGYITDALNGYALDWIEERDADEPFSLYLSHKAVHADFIPAERHADQYADAAMPVPETMADTPENRKGKPLWAQNQRNSWHGVEFPYHSGLDVLEYRRRYNQTLSAVDDGLGAILDRLEERGLMENTVVFLMGDNGFMFGEHGLIDKRNAYEASMRVPLLAYGAGVAEGATVSDVVAGIDIGPTILDLARAEAALPDADGSSFAAQLTSGEDADGWRDAFLYEYYWEYNYPHTPTTLAVRTDRYKYIQYHGVWDTEELYDLSADPQERVNLIDDPEHYETKVALRAELYDLLAEGHEGRPSVEFSERRGPGALFRHEDRSKAAAFPVRWLRPDGAPDATDHWQDEESKSEGD